MSAQNTEGAHKHKISVLTTKTVFILLNFGYRKRRPERQLLCL